MWDYECLVPNVNEDLRTGTVAKSDIYGACGFYIRLGFVFN